MRGRDVIVIGFSAGGVDALVRLAADLPPDLSAALFVVHHFPAESESALASIISRAGGLPALHPAHGDQIEPGRIYIAPPGRHMLITGDRIHLTRGPRENGHRPAIDPLFRTAARTFGPRVVGVLLSGTLDDGTVGMMAVKRHGGIAVVQDPNEALHAGMLESAIQRVPVDHVLPVQQIAQLLTRLAREPVAQKEGSGVFGQEDQEPQDPAEIGTASLKTGLLPGPPTSLTCPDCGGTLWELISGNLVRYRCHVGHAYTSDSMVTAQGTVLENALWTALRALEEKRELSRRLAERTRGRGLERLARRYESAVANAERGSNGIRQLLLSGIIESPTATSGGRSAPEQAGWPISTPEVERA